MYDWHFVFNIYIHITTKTKNTNLKNKTMDNLEQLKIFFCLPNGQKKLEKEFNSWVETQSTSKSFKIIQRLMTTTGVGSDMVDFTSISIFYIP